MENQRVNKAIKDAEEWLSSAKRNRDADVYSKSLYELEMSLEVSIKAIFIALNIEFPKEHNVGLKLKEVYNSRKGAFPISFSEDIDGIIEIFYYLLKQRNAAGYSFESSFTEEDFRNSIKRHFDEAEKAIKKCMGAATKIAAASPD